MSFFAIPEDVMERNVMRPIVTCTADVKVNPSFGALSLHLGNDVSKLLDRHGDIELNRASKPVITIQKSSHLHSPTNVEGKRITIDYA